MLKYVGNYISEVKYARKYWIFNKKILINKKAVYKAMEQGVEDGKVKSIGISNYYTKQEIDEVLSYATITPAVIQNENHIYYQNNETIKEIGEEYNKTSAQIILRWQIQAGYIVIPGSSNPDHIAENYDIFTLELSEKDMNNIANINISQRYENW